MTLTVTPARNGTLPTPAPGGRQQITTTQDFQNLAARLGQQVTMVRVCISRWRGRVKLKGASVKHEGIELQPGEDVTEPQLYLIPKEWENRFERVEHALRRAIDRRTIKIRTYTDVELADGTTETQSQVVDDANVVPRAVEPIIRQEIRTIVQEQWNPLVQEFMTALPELVEELQRNKPREVWELIAARLPHDLQSIRGSFQVIYMPRPLGVSMDDMTMEALRQESGQYLQALAESIVRENVKILQDSVGNLQDLLARKSVLRTSSVENVLEAIGVFKSFASTMDAEDLVGHFREAEEILRSNTAQDLNSDNRNGCQRLSQQLQEALGKIKDSVSASELLRKQSERKQRSIVI